MPTLDIKRITDKLNAEFAQTQTRKIVFWYDDAAAFAEDIDSIALAGAKLHRLTATNQFRTKHMLERRDTESSYLIYAPFPKPDIRENALEDTLLYSRRFHADLPSIIADDLGMDEKLKPLLQKHIKFFASKERTQRFYDFETSNHTAETIELAMLCSLCKTDISPNQPPASFEDLLRAILISHRETDPQLNEFDKYGLLPSFWRMCDENLGYADVEPTIPKLACMLFATYTSKQFRGETPKRWEKHISYKSGSVIAFVDSMMNSAICQERYDEMAKSAASTLNARESFRNADIGQMLDCCAFEIFDERIIEWIAGRLLDEDIGAAAAGHDIPAICELRMKKHFGAQYAPQYGMLKSAYEIVRQTRYAVPEQFGDIVKQYVARDYRIDSQYRSFYLSYDRLADADIFEKLRALVETIYANNYLGRLLPAFNATIDARTIMRGDQSQRRFFVNNIKYAKEKTAVIISDAMRYDVGRELFDKLSGDPNCDAEMKHMIGILPAYTQLGMAALLPHKTLEITSDGKALADKKPCDDIAKREAILQSALPNSRCIRADRLPANRSELREVFNGMDAVYIYHDHIDNRGSTSDNEVFAACAEAADEIYAIIKRLWRGGNVYRFVVTCDHGFLYKRERFAESEKISIDRLKGAYANRRFVIAGSAIESDGVVSAPLADIIGGADERIVSWPSGATVFKTRGSLNYVHGGASPQEIILPLIIVKAEKGHVDTHPAKIALVSMVRRITSLATQLEFIQKEPVSDIVTPAEYRLGFISEDNEKISNEHLYQADKKDTDPSKRVFRCKFNFKNRKYDPAKQYWLTATNTKTGEELFRHQVTMDNAYANDFLIVSRPPLS